MSTSASIASATGRIRGTMQGSCRPPTVIATAFPWISRVCWTFAIDGVGFTAIRTTISCPDEIPPRMPPAWLLENPVAVIGSLFSLPNFPGNKKPVADLHPLDRTDPHHGAGDCRVKFPEDRVTEAGRAAGRHNLRDPAHRVPGRFCREDLGFDLLRGGFAVHGDDPAGNRDPFCGEVLQRHGPGGDPADRLPARTPAAAPVITDTGTSPGT